jgi:uncharacterized membrane protein
MNFKNAKIFYGFLCFVLSLIILSPLLFSFISIPEGKDFTELWLLGSNHEIETDPLIIFERTPFTVYLGVANHMGDLEYYKIYVKLRHQNETLPDREKKLSSSLEPLFEYRLFLSNDETWEKKLLVSFEDVKFEGNISRVSRLSINGYAVNMDKIVAWDETSRGFYCQLFFELWVYNSTTSDFQFHNRYVSLWINLSAA